MKTDRHFVFPSVCLFCLRLANCIMKMSINFPTICRQTGMYVCHIVLPPSSHTHPLTRTHTHSQLPVTLNANCKLSSSAGGKYWHDRHIFILFYLHFYFTLCLLQLRLQLQLQLQLHLLFLFFCFSIFIQLHLWRLVPWLSPKTFANHVFCFYIFIFIGAACAWRASACV